MHFWVVAVTLASLYDAYIGALGAKPPSGRGKEEVKFRLYIKGSTMDTPEVVNGPDKITFTKLSLQKPIKIIIHGWKGDEKCEFNSDMIKGFLASKDCNVLAVDWSGFGALTPYLIARSKVPEVAAEVAKFIDNLHDQRGVDLATLHVIGHSLGAHIAGIAGYLVKNGKIGRITGLDPALPLFSAADARGRLSKDSALFVDVIHTSSNTKGFGIPLGHVDFYPNGPHMLQPGCGLDIVAICSHKRSVDYYVESLASPNGFPAVPCADWEQFQRKRCDANAAVTMGDSTLHSARGSYFLATNSKPPFGKGTIW